VNFSFPPKIIILTQQNEPFTSHDFEVHIFSPYLEFQSYQDYVWRQLLLA
jgi:hypothetical protein